MNTACSSTPARTPRPPGFRARRGLNWGAFGLMYAAYYMCRCNFRFATPGMQAEFGVLGGIAMFMVMRKQERMTPAAG